MANKAKPIDLTEGVFTKSNSQKRREVENVLKGVGDIRKEPPSDLCSRGQEIYSEIIEAFPDDFLAKIDVYIVGTVADSLAQMERIRLQINELDPLAVSESKLVITYQKYSDILKKFSGELGLSPAGRSQLGYLVAKQQDTEKDPLLKVLKSKK